MLLKQLIVTINSVILHSKLQVHICFDSVHNMISLTLGTSWKDVFEDNQRWYGSYYYNEEKFKCSMSIYHVVKEGLGTVYAGFTDPDTSIELEGIHKENYNK